MKRERYVVETQEAWLLRSESGTWWYSGVATMSGTPDHAARFGSEKEALDCTKTGGARHSYHEELWQPVHVTFRLVMVPKLEVLLDSGEDVSWAARVGVR